MKHPNNATAIPLTEMRQVDVADELNNMIREIKRLKHKVNVLIDTVAQVAPNAAKEFRKEV